MSNWKTDVKYVKGVGPNRVKLLNKLGIFDLADLITYFPRMHEDRSKPKKIAEIVDGEEVLIEGIAMAKMSELRIRPSLAIYKLIIRDDTGSCLVTWYNQPYLKKQFQKGETYKFFGKASNKLGKIELNSPVYDKENMTKNTGKIIPIYASTYDLSQNVIRKIIENGLKEAGEIEETLPDYLLQDYHFIDRKDAIWQIHFPSDFEQFFRARKRLVFEELMQMQLALLWLKNKYRKEEQGIAFPKEVQMSDVIASLPFKLTKAQIKVLEEITQDMELAKPMNRLLQGDVGSRKNNCGTT